MATEPLEPMSVLDELPYLAAMAQVAAEQSAEATKARDAKILEAAKTGATYNALAKAVGVTTWRIGQILKRQRTQA